MNSFIAAVATLVLPHAHSSFSERRHLTLQQWSATTSSVRPLDLKLDPVTNQVYQVGKGGFLEPYDLENYQLGFDAVHNFRGSGGKGNDEGVIHHESMRSGLSNFDWRRWNLFDHRDVDVERKLNGSALDPEGRVTSSIFVYTEGNDPYDLLEDESKARHLQEYYDLSSAHTKGELDGDKSYRDQASDFVKDTNSQKDMVGPVVRSTFPPPRTLIGPNQSFGALVSDGDGTGIQFVCLQFKDHTGSRSDCFDLVNVGEDIWELTFDGFDSFEGMTWSYRIRSKDGAKNRVNTDWADFVINISGKGEGTEDGGGQGGDVPEVDGTKLLTDVRDESWPYGGVVQTSTGRILFFFDGNAYVCTGTVLQDDLEDRTIILTAAHCAYQYQPSGGRFAEHALFIPAQDDTTGAKSDDICGNDPLGCWIPAFAVVDHRWTQTGFPDSVPYDYAYYIIANDSRVHQKGYLHEADSSLSELLPDLVEPIPIDFNFDGSEFTTGLGYSFDKDPDFRYCAGQLSTKFGIQTYANLWIETCGMTGGSSGGPWMMNMDTSGRGTVISVNSWGYTSSSGMGGPNLSTVSGSHAECLYERAKSRNLDSEGYIVEDC